MLPPAGLRSSADRSSIIIRTMSQFHPLKDIARVELPCHSCTVRRTCPLECFFNLVDDVYMYVCLFSDSATARLGSRLGMWRAGCVRVGFFAGVVYAIDPGFTFYCSGVGSST
jgi:hypothetical protein